MSFEESLQDVTIRERQLTTHILRSSEYIRYVDRHLKRQVTMLYLAISLLLVFQGLFAFQTAGELSAEQTILTAFTSLLAIITCFLLIQTKAWLQRLNEAWLNPHEKSALDILKEQRAQILTRVPGSKDDARTAEWN